MKESSTNDWMKKSLSGDRCAKEKRSHQSCAGDVSGVVKPRANFVKKTPVDQDKFSVSSVERVSDILKG